MVRRAAWAIAGLLLLAMGAGLPGCAAPTLPLPPPEMDVSTPDAGGVVTVTGTARPSALVMVFNQDLEQGVITIADGTTGGYQARLAAQSGHTITVWQRIGTDTSTAVSKTVP